MVTTSCNLLLAQTRRCQVGDSLHLTDLGDGRLNEVEVFDPWTALKCFSITVGCFAFLVIVIWSCHWQVWSTNSNMSEQDCLNGKQKVTAVSGFQVFSWTMQKESERSASSGEVGPSELLGILQFAWFDATFKTVPIYSELERGLQRRLLKFNLLV